MNHSRLSRATPVQINSTVSPALRSLVGGSIDYAGLFPPAELPLELALQNYARYLRSKGSWMLNSFVLPSAQFAAASAHFSRFDAEHPLRISALGSRSQNAAEFADKLAATAEAIRQLQS